jgi:hypothetical protein
LKLVETFDRKRYKELCRWCGTKLGESHNVFCNEGCGLAFDKYRSALDCFNDEWCALYDEYLPWFLWLCVMVFRKVVMYGVMILILYGAIVLYPHLGLLEPDLDELGSGSHR